MTLEERVALAKIEARIEDPRVVSRRREVWLRVVAITLSWLVITSLLIGWGLTGAPGRERDVAALLAIVVPFVPAVLATRNGQFRLGGLYTILTLAMVFPALGIAGLA